MFFAKVCVCVFLWLWLPPVCTRVVPGAGLYGLLPTSGTGESVDHGLARPVGELKAVCAKRNEVLLRSLRCDPLEEELHRLTLEDAKLGRISWPRSVAERNVGIDELDGISICPR